METVLTLKRAFANESSPKVLDNALSAPYMRIQIKCSLSSFRDGGGE